MVTNALTKAQVMKLTKAQVMKGRELLMNQWLTKTGVERKNHPFGVREQQILKHFKTIRLVDYLSLNRFNRYSFPIYEVISTDGRKFRYYVYGGKVNIIR